MRRLKQNDRVKLVVPAKPKVERTTTNCVHVELSESLRYDVTFAEPPDGLVSLTAHRYSYLSGGATITLALTRDDALLLASVLVEGAGR